MRLQTIAHIPQRDSHCPKCGIDCEPVAVRVEANPLEDGSVDFPDASIEALDSDCQWVPLREVVRTARGRMVAADALAAEFFRLTDAAKERAAECVVAVGEVLQ